jgi:hypothetical protein
VVPDLVWLRAERWVPIIIWLSLDAVRPHWAALGLDGAGQDARVALLRRFILDAANARWTRPNAVSSLIPDVLAALADERSEAEAAEFIRFARFTFAMDSSDHPELFAWQEILNRCEFDTANFHALVPWAELRGPFSGALRRASAAVVHEALALPLSSWDAAMLALRRIDDADPSAPEHPMRLVEQTSRVASARAFWGAVLPLLDDDRREVLAWNGTRLAWSLGTLAPDASLPDPVTLVEANRG